MSDPLVRLEREGTVATLVFDQPERRNAMTEAMGEAFSLRVAELMAEPDLRAVILTGAGRAFSAGGDLAMIEGKAKLGAEAGADGLRRNREGMRGFYKLFLSIRDLPCPTIAAINGHAIGAGLCVALGCDIRFAAAEAKLGLNFTKLGLHPGMGASWTLPRIVGPARAAELLYTSRLIDGEEAHRIGLVSRVLPADEVLPTARAVAAEIAACAPLANTDLKRGLARSETASLEDQLAYEADRQAQHFASRDIHEGLAAARDRRAPKFEGH